MRQNVKAVLFGMIGLLLALPSHATLITQTIDFSFTDFSTTGPTVPHDFIEGTVVFTYDNATSTSIFGQSVDSLTFSTPNSFFPTTDLLFDLRIGTDKLFATNGHEFSFYYSERPVSLIHGVGSTDFLIDAAGASTTPGTGPLGMLMIYSERPTASEFGFFSSSLNTNSTSFELANVTPLPAPGAAVLLLLGLVGLVRSRPVS